MGADLCPPSGQTQPGARAQPGGHAHAFTADAHRQGRRPWLRAHQAALHGGHGPETHGAGLGHQPRGHFATRIGGFAALDPYTGKVLSADYLSGGQNTPNLIISSFFALHMASFGGVAVWWLYFLLGLAGAWLFYSGNLLWVETRRKAQRKGSGMPVQRRDTTLMSAATVGVCIGCVAGVSLTLAAAKWLPGRVDNLAAWHVGIYYTVFFASVAWAFLRGAPRAAVPLLYLAAACTAAIPLSSLLGWLLPDSGLWVDGSLLSVDVTALAGALALVWMARATARRVRHGPEDSVWSMPRDGVAPRALSTGGE
ncbi:PepSY domain-containing protein [Ottowia sp. VDI28]|uniref:PepSY domain-containing protein n=1 Tax=Ottowia sp. VDI28 TaxID=3133968 RepID=UPI003C2B16F1